MRTHFQADFRAMDHRNSSVAAASASPNGEMDIDAPRPAQPSGLPRFFNSPVSNRIRRHPPSAPAARNDRISDPQLLLDGARELAKSGQPVRRPSLRQILLTTTSYCATTPRIGGNSNTTTPLPPIHRQPNHRRPDPPPKHDLPQFRPGTLLTPNQTVHIQLIGRWPSTSNSAATAETVFAYEDPRTLFQAETSPSGRQQKPPAHQPLSRFPRLSDSHQ